MEIPIEKQEIKIAPENRVAEEPKQRKQALTCANKVSSFFITIAFNYYVHDKSESDFNAYKQKVEKVISEALPSFYKFFDWKTSKLGEKFGYSDKDPEEVLLKKDRVIENSLKYVYEISPSGKYHAHILFYVRTKGVDKKLNIPRLKNYLTEKLGSTPYLNYKLVPSVMTLENYMSKNPIN